jgi:hypothetical protein
MRIDILATRLAEKSNTPQLADFVLGRKPINELPNDCMIWTGKKTTAGLTIKKGRDCLNIPVAYRAIRKPLGQIQVSGKTEYVHRLVYKLLLKPDYEFYMRNICGNSLCCNPKHWDVSSNQLDVVFDTAEWTLEEVEEAIEAMLSRYDVYRWSDVESNPLMQDIPHHLIKECLIKINKEHLTCP